MRSKNRMAIGILEGEVVDFLSGKPSEVEFIDSNFSRNAGIDLGDEKIFTGGGAQEGGEKQQS